MDAAKSAVKSFINKAGHHDTTVDETVNPAVTSETVKPHRHEETTQAVDREVHQDHYHTTVQPVTAKEVLPEQHTHQQAPVQEREFTHGDSHKVRAGVEHEAAKFADTSRTHQTTHTQSQAAAVTGEHVHHHVHETVQPVIHKETVQPEVVHTTIPIHETHHAQAEHHGLSTLPTKTIDEFKTMGGSVVGGTQRHEEYEGHPRPYNPSMQTSRSSADVEPKAHDGIHHPHSGSTGVSGATGSTNVSGIENISSGTGYSGTAASTGTALGGRTEGNTTGRALDAAESRHGTHGGTGAVAGIATGAAEGHHHSTAGASSNLSSSNNNTSRSFDNTTSSAGGAVDHSISKDHANTSTSTRPARAEDATTGAADTGKDIQSPSQGKDPSTIERSGGKWVGEGVDGSHSAVFGLTPDGHKYNDTGHGVSSLKPAHSKNSSSTSPDLSRGAAGGGVAEQMQDLKVAEKGHSGAAASDAGSAKPGAGSLGGEQGFGQIRPGEHGQESKLANKLDPTTDADHDGKSGVLD